MSVLEQILREIEDYREIASSNGNFNSAASFKKCEDIIKKYMSAEDMNVPTNDGWISVEKGLPPDGSDCIITDRNGVLWQDISYGFSRPEDKKKTFYQWDDEGWRCFYPDVAAWRFPPEPYKPEKLV